MDRTDEPLLPRDTRWLIDPDGQAVCWVIEAAGHQVFFVGGCVRNALMGLADSDVDISTDALPEQVMQLAADAGLKALPTGIDHGTITVISNGFPFEVTTFRRDVATDGRRAVVAFSDDIAEDALRRDFTMNALYATPKGALVDPLGGLPDLLARRIKFIENADARIQEDYLRTLRFFRFFAWYGDQDQGFDAAAIDAIAQNIAGLKTLSAERIGQEMRKLLSAPDPTFALAGMRITGVLNAILPSADDTWIGMITQFETVLDLNPDWIRRLAALGGQDVETRLRLSKVEARAHALSRAAAFEGGALHEIAYRHGAIIAQTALLLRGAMAEQMPDRDELAVIDAAANETFPIKSADLSAQFQGPALGQKLRELEQIWIDSRFTLKKSELLNHG